MSDSIDDLLNEINSTESTKKGKKGKGKKAVEKPAEKEVLNKIEEEPASEIIPQKNDEPQLLEENVNEQEPEAEDTGPKEKKKKKVVKVVKKKPAGKQDKLVKLLQEQNKLLREKEEKLRKEEDERRKQEEEQREIEMKLEEERLLKEKEQEEIDRAEREKWAKLHFDPKENAKNQQKTLNLAKQLGFSTVEEYLNHLATEAVQHKPLPRKKKGNTAKDKAKADTVEDNLVDEEQIDENKEDEVDENVINNEEIDDWENFLDENEEDKPVDTKVESKTIEVIQPKVQNKKHITKDFSDSESEDEDVLKGITYRAPVICILGHVDTGKTKILDKIRKTNVQEGEAGGITQQIGATFFPLTNFEDHFKKLDRKFQIKSKFPGILVIDTPGHESFQNLRSRGSSLCDLAVLVIDIMHGIEKQTLDSIELLKQKKTPFVIALNKIDRCYLWKPNEWGAYKTTLEKQKSASQKEFRERADKIIKELIKLNFNVSIFDENTDMKEYINLIPTSAVTGEGIPDLLGVLNYLSNKFLSKKLIFSQKIKATVLEVKLLESMGTTIDVILVNGSIKVGDKIVLSGLYGPIKTQIKLILTPHPMKEIRINKSDFEHHDKINGVIGAKIFANGLENALAGSPLFVYEDDEEAEEHCEEILNDFNSIVKSYISKSGKGVMVQSSTLGSLEAILTYLHDKSVPISLVGIGNMQKKDVLKLQTLHANMDHPLKEYLTVLAFDVKVNAEAKEFANLHGIKIFEAPIIYHLLDNYIEYEKNCIEERKNEKLKEAIFPFEAKMVLNAAFNKREPIIIGVDITRGIMKVGTPIYVKEKKFLLGVVEGIQSNSKPVNNIRSNNGSVAIRIKPHEANFTYGRHFDDKDTYVSQISRKSIDSLKEFFRDDMTKDDWGLVKDLKKVFDIM